MFELLKDAAKLGLIVASVWLALSIYGRRERDRWSTALLARRLTLVWMLILVLIAIKVGEDVLGEESGLFDSTVLWFIHRQVGPGPVAFFQAITATASFAAASCVAGAASLGLLVAGRRFEAALVGASTAGAALGVWMLKVLVDRSRPVLWETQWYWGSSFPSGHTLVAAALGMALVVVVRRLWPAWQRWALALAVTWITLVGLSRLVLGVHWPTDVIAAACIGALLPLSLNLAAELRLLRRESTRGA